MAHSSSTETQLCDDRRDEMEGGWRDDRGRNYAVASNSAPAGECPVCSTLFIMFPQTYSSLAVFLSVAGTHSLSHHARPLAPTPPALHNPLYPHASVGRRGTLTRTLLRHRPPAPPATRFIGSLRPMIGPHTPFDPAPRLSHTLDLVLLTAPCQGRWRTPFRAASAVKMR